MGLKRSFDEDLQELSFKHPKQLDSSEQLTSLAEISPSYRASQKTDIPGEAVGIFCESLAPEVSKYDISNVVSDFNDTEFETSLPISWVTSSTSEEDAGSEAVLCSSDFPEHFEFNFPGSKLIQFEDTYSSLLNSSPRKEVPVGPDYQADVPVWDPEVIKQNSKSSTYGGDVDDNGEEMKGACVMPIADFSADVGKTKEGGPDCSCLDDVSVRCVKQHVKEAREKLKETIGHEKFVTLGFLDMGEEVAHNWTEEEEQLFHEVVYSNPASLGKNFWVHLSTMFPSRTKQELVCYYFNVFMLRRRAAQNRSCCLEIDSDDDEWKGNGGQPFGVMGEDENSAAVSFINQGVRFDYGDDTQFEYGGDDSSSSSSSDDSDDDNDNNDNGDVDGNSQVYGLNAIENAEGKYHMSKGKIENTCDDCRFDLMDGFLGSIREFSDVQEDSCTSFEGQPFMMDSFCPIGERAAIKEIKVNRAHGKFLHRKSVGSSDKFGAEYALEPCEGKAWDAPYSTGLMKSVDLLPTCNVMEEIFGACTWNSKSSNDKSIS